MKRDIGHMAATVRFISRQIVVFGLKLDDEDLKAIQDLLAAVKDLDNVVHLQRRDAK